MTDVAAALAGRRSCRAYRPEPIAVDLLDTVLAASLRGPSAGNTWALDLVVLDDEAAVAGYWDTSLPSGPRRDAFPWPGLLRAPVLVVPTIRIAAYTERYAEADKAATRLGESPDRWPVPYWWVDAGAAVMAMLLAASGLGLGSLLFGTFEREDALRERFGVPGDRRVVGTIALGWPDEVEHRGSASARRGRPELVEVVHRGRW